MLLAWRTRILVHIEATCAFGSGKPRKIPLCRVFAGNLRDLLLTAPAGARPTMGLDPGYRTGVKVAVVSETGQVAAVMTIPHEPQRRWNEKPQSERLRRGKEDTALGSQPNKSGIEQLYRSPNGDTWFLARNPTTGLGFIRHRANAWSGGQVTSAGT